MSQVVEGVCKMFLFLIAADWISPIIVSNVFLRLSRKNCSINFII